MQKNLKSFCQNEALKIGAVGLWVAANAFLFIYSYFGFKTDDKFNYMFLMCGEAIYLARSSAAVINLNCALILLPMCRTINTWLRTKILKHLKSTPRRLFDHLKGIHILCAYVICIASVVHTIAHLVNFYSFYSNFSPAVPDINLEKTQDDTTLLAFLRSVPGWSGVVLLVILTVVFCCSFKAIRRIHYEIFLYVHHLALIFLAIMMVHGFGDVTKFQTNIDRHPKECHSLTDFVDSAKCVEPPTFQHVSPASWKWMAGPLALYLLDRLIRFIRSMKRCELVKVTIHESDVIELVMYKKGFKAKPGNFILVQCPEIAEFEWHAFTLTKCPTGPERDEATFSVHIKVTGDWTEKLLKRVSQRDAEGNAKAKRIGESTVITVEENDLPIVKVDGPYGSPNQDAFRYPVNVCIAAGIGITPYAAVLNQLKYYEPENLKKNFKLKKMHLIWVCRSMKEFTWILKLIKEVEDRLRKLGSPDLLDCRLYVTRDAKLQLKEGQEGDLMSNLAPNAFEMWLERKKKYGRPNFKEELTKVAMANEKQRIGVFYCGPGPIAKSIYEQCSTISQRGNSFIFNKESFA